MLGCSRGTESVLRLHTWLHNMSHVDSAARSACSRLGVSLGYVRSAAHGVVYARLSCRLRLRLQCHTRAGMSEGIERKHLTHGLSADRQVFVYGTSAAATCGLLPSSAYAPSAPATAAKHLVNIASRDMLSAVVSSSPASRRRRDVQELSRCSALCSAAHHHPSRLPNCTTAK